LAGLASAPETARQMGRRGRAAFLATHEKDACCARWSALIAEMVGARPGRRAEVPVPALHPH